MSKIVKIVIAAIVFTILVLIILVILETQGVRNFGLGQYNEKKENDEDLPDDDEPVIPITPQPDEGGEPTLPPPDDGELPVNGEPVIPVTPPVDGEPVITPDDGELPDDGEPVIPITPLVDKYKYKENGRLMNEQYYRLTTSVPSVEECLKLCDGDTNCKAVSHNLGEQKCRFANDMNIFGQMYDTSSNLFGQTMGWNTYSTSPFRKFTLKDGRMPDRDYVHKRENVNTPQACLYECDIRRGRGNNEHCAQFSFNPKNKYCWLSNNINDKDLTEKSSEWKTYE